ncbi:hypothetical protein [Dyella sp. C11]|uniref:hypothetical protein n=1 Tax=Dyella sp. C11 TaxID=2126991 RepID=UPI000D64716F|nr:hypothetical protein [Dyella sp. C11]
MPRLQQHVSRAIALGLRAQKGAAVAVGVTLEHGEPRVMFSTLLACSEDGDALSIAPYTLAAGMPRDPKGRATAEALAAVAEGRRGQDALATRGLQALLDDLRAQGYTSVSAALLVNRAGWITDLLQYSLAWAEHVPVAELMGVRDAMRAACGQCGIELTELDEKSLPEVAGAALGLPADAMPERLKALGASVGRPWRKEQKLACLSAWLLAAGLG